MYSEYMEEAANVKIPVDSIRDWLEAFSDPHFTCFFEMHGKKMVGLVTLRIKKRFLAQEAEIESFIVRREFRGRIKPLRMLVHATRRFLDSKGVNKMVMMLPEGKIPRSFKRSNLVRVENGHIRKR